jgi:hypothetical protein
MNRHRLTAALVFGWAAHAELLLFNWILGSSHTLSRVYNDPWHLIASPRRLDHPPSSVITCTEFNHRSTGPT